MKTFHIENRRYLGSKAKLIDFIHQVVDENCKGITSVADIFAGTGNVAWSFNDEKTKVIVNDILTSNNYSYQAWFGNEPFSQKKIEDLISLYNSMNPTKENYFSENFSGTYFSRENCLKIGFIRDDIDTRFNSGEINKREKAILITSLIYAMDHIANTVGHYDAYRLNGDLSAKLMLDSLDLPSDGVNDNNEIFCEDANQLVRHLKADLVYIDPPYNSRQYCDSYHLLENVADWKKQPVYGVAKKAKRTKEVKSLYCTQKAPIVFDDLIQNIDAKYILVSYNNMGTKGAGRSQAKISDQDIICSLSKRGKVLIFSTEFNQFNAGKTHIMNHQERLFLCITGKKDASAVEDDTHPVGYVKSPLNYTGGKYRLLLQLLTHFDASKTTFVDLFGGGFNVGANVPQKEIIYCDKQDAVTRLIRLIDTTSYYKLLQGIENTIKHYHLSDTTMNGYSYYGCESSSGVGSYNKPYYAKLREAYNQEKSSEKKDLLFLTLTFYSFNNQIRFNSDGEDNMPVGKRDFNSCARKNLLRFSSRIKEKNIRFFSCDFEKILPLLDDSCFVYCDPPYYLAEAAYNEKDGWTLDDEKRLLSFLVQLNEKGIRFALSNVIEHRGKRHPLLVDWVTENHFNLNYVKSDYSNASYHKKNRDTASVEVLITN